jgi:hypothetical protein
MPPRLAAAALATLLLLGATSALAHDPALVAVQLARPEPGASQVQERLTLAPETLALLVPAVDADGDGALGSADLEARRAALEVGVWDSAPLSAGGQPCQRLATSAEVRDSHVELEATFSCARGELRQRFALLSVLPPSYRVVLASRVGPQQAQHFADSLQPTVVVPEPRSMGPQPGSSLASWVGLGLLHIFTGVDHLAFLLGLLVVGGSLGRLLALITAFTLAHSLTLGATALGLVVLGEGTARLVEVLIAASVAWVAVENLVLREHRHRPLLTFLFGLVHGFGFASVLGEYGLGDSVAVGLFGFNLGVELGQAAVVGALLPLVRQARQYPARHLQAVRVLSVALLLSGGYWLLERALG